MLRFHLPPNFAAAAARDAVPLRVDVDVNVPPTAELLPALALLQRWTGAATPPRFIQVSRAQLRDLAAVAGDQAIFMENGRPTAWRHAAVIAHPSEPTRAPARGPASRDLRAPPAGPALRTTPPSS